MPQYLYRGRDKEGRLRVGQRFSSNIDMLNSELIKEGISTIQITVAKDEHSYWDKLKDWVQGKSLYISELSIFARQMQLLHQANVPITTALKQLGSHTRSHKLAHALNGVIEHLEKGESLATSMQHYPQVFSNLMVNIIQIGENTGHLSESFSQIHDYLEFEANTTKQIKSAFRYPIFVTTSIVFAFIVLNLFVIPTFAKFYSNLTVSLPWETRLLIGISNFFVHYGLYFLIVILISGFFLFRYLKTREGQYRWNKLQLSLPLVGPLLRRIIIIRFTQSLAIILNSGISVTQGLILIKNIIINAYIIEQISHMQEAIERGVPFTHAIEKIDIFAPLELQILSVGEKNGELSPALSYIARFHSDEIQFELKRLNDFIAPILISVVSVLILIVALGIYLPIWNMINLVHS